MGGIGRKDGFFTLVARRPNLADDGISLSYGGPTLDKYGSVENLKGDTLLRTEATRSRHISNQADMGRTRSMYVVLV